MSRSLAEMPAVEFTGADIMTGRLPGLQARAALDHGPIYKWVISEGYDAGEYVFLVGPEANRFEDAADGWEAMFGRIAEAQTELFATLRTIIAERRGRPASGPPRDVLGLIVTARDEAGAPLSDEQILGHLNILLVAGHETTT